MGDADFRDQRQDERDRLRIAPFVFLRPRVLFTAPRQELKTAIHWEPRIELRRLEYAIERRTSIVEGVFHRHTQTRVIERERMALRLVEKGARAEDGRIAARVADRVETRASTPGKPVPGSPEMRLNRQPNAAILESRLTEEAGRSRGFSRTPAAPPVDLNRLTDSVMRQIDRRLEAHRERMWRK